MNNVNRDVIIIGGGLAGLTTAVYLARAGKQVTLLEKANALGGRAMTQEKAGFLFNQGPHALYVEGAGHAILKELGIPFQGKKPLTVKKSWGVQNGRLHLLPGDARSFLQTDLLDGRGKAALGKFFLSLMRTDPSAITHQTAQAWLDQQISHPQLRQLVEMLGRVATYAHSTETVSAQVWVQQLQFALGKNVLYLDGGWQTLVDGLQKAAVAAGITIHTGQRVTAVTEHTDQTTVTVASGEQYQAQHVVVATNPTHLAELLPDHPVVKNWRETAVPIRAAVLDIALNRLTIPNHLLAFGLDAPLYLATHSPFAKLTPSPDNGLIHVMKYLAPNEAGQDSRAELEGLLDLVQPNWRSELVHSRFLPEMTVTPWLATAQGDGLNGRPPLQIPGHASLFLAGDWVGSSGWLADAAFASGLDVARLILDQATHQKLNQRELLIRG